jgi:hypothetical protein
MTTLTNPFRFLPAGQCGTQNSGSASWAPDAATEQSLLLGAVLVAFAGAAGVVTYALGQVVAFH